MNKKLIKELKEKLKKEKESLEKELKSFAEDKKLKGDWDTRFPYSNKETGGSALEEAADEVEEYEILLSIEHSLELKLKNINLALEKIKKDGYGICENCQKPISIKKLKISPEARICLKCKK